MYNPITILSQILHIIPRVQFDSFVGANSADKYVKSFSTWNQLTTMVTAQTKGWNSLREVQTGFLTQSSKLYHVGITNSPKRSNLSYANSKRSYEIFESLFYELLKKCRGKLIGKKLKFKAPLYVFDSTYLELCINLFNWARFRATKGALKIHTSFEVQEQIPTFIRVTNGNIHDLEGILQDLSVYSDSILVFDRIYTDINYFAQIDKAEATFVARLKSNIKYKVIGQQLVSKRTGVIKDEIIVFETVKSRERYPKKLRLITFHDRERDRTFKFVTNNFNYAASTIAYIYKKRWEVEIFFKWIKQNLKIKTFMGTNRNAVLIQIWVAMVVYLLLSYMKSQSSYSYSLLEFTRVIREVLFENMSLVDIFSANFRSLVKIREPDPCQYAMI